MTTGPAPSPAVQITPGAATPPAASPLAAISPPQGEQQADEQQQQQAQGRAARPGSANGGQRKKKGRHPVEVVFRTAGLAGVVGAVALQLLQHAGRGR